MSKILTIALTALGTLGASAGAVAVVNNVPATKDKISISVNNTDIAGNKAETSLQDKAVIENLNTELANEQEKTASTENALYVEKQNVATLTNKVAELEETKATNEAEISKLESNKSALETQVSTLTNEVETKTNEISSLEKQVQANNTRISELETNAEANAEEIAQLNAENANLNSQIESKTAEVEEKNTQISTLNSTIASQTSRIEELQTQNSQHETTIESLNSQLEEKNTTIAQLETSLAESQSKVSELQSKVDKYAQALENHVVVSYSVNDDETIQLQDRNSQIDCVVPAKSNSYFLGWSLTEDGEVLPADYIIEEDCDLYAKYIDLEVGKSYNFQLGVHGSLNNNLYQLSASNAYLYSFNNQDSDNEFLCFLIDGASVNSYDRIWYLGNFKTSYGFGDMVDTQSMGTNTSAILRFERCAEDGEMKYFVANIDFSCCIGGEFDYPAVEIQAEFSNKDFIYQTLYRYSVFSENNDLSIIKLYDRLNKEMVYSYNMGSPVVSINRINNTTIDFSLENGEVVTLKINSSDATYEFVRDEYPEYTQVYLLNEVLTCSLSGQIPLNYTLNGKECSYIYFDTDYNVLAHDFGTFYVFVENPDYGFDKVGWRNCESRALCLKEELDVSSDIGQWILANSTRLK